MVATRERLQKTSFSRVWTIEGGAAPQTAPVYQGLGRAGALAWSMGDVTPVRVPSPDAYDQFDIITTIKGQRGLPSLPLEVRRQITVSELLKLAKRGCEIDLQIHVGACKNPSDFDGGWTDGMVGILEGANITAYNTDALGALDANERAVVMETLPMTGLDYYEVKTLVAEILASTTITDEVLDVAVCDAVTCGNCGLPSDGNNVVFALVSDSSGSPGIAASVVYTKDGWATASKSILTALTIGQNPTALACMGGYLVVVSNNGLRHAYVKIADLLAGTGVWTAVTSGYVAAKGPNDIVVLRPDLAIIVGDGGYVYRLTDPTGAVTVASAGDQTTQNLTKVKNFSNDAVVAIGGSNAVLVSYDGDGRTWGLVVGPSAGVTLLTIDLVSYNRWFIGTNAGALYYTLDGGANWTLKTFASIAGTGAVRALAFATRNVGYLAWDENNATTNSARVYRTINGGYSWFRIPEVSGSFPTAWRINEIAIGADANTIFAGGLATDGNDGVLVRCA